MKRLLLLIPAAIMGAGILAPPVHADTGNELAYLQLLNYNGITVTDATRAILTGYAVCDAMNTMNGEDIAAYIFTHSTWAETPNLETAGAIVTSAGQALCPWHFHPERLR